MIKKVTISFEVKKPEHIEDNDFTEWLNFELGISGEIKNTNELIDIDLRDGISNIMIQKA